MNNSKCLRACNDTQGFFFILYSQYSLFCQTLSTQDLGQISLARPASRIRQPRYYHQTSPTHFRTISIIFIKVVISPIISRRFTQFLALTVLNFHPFVSLVLTYTLFHNYLPKTVSSSKVFRSNQAQKS